MVLAFMLGTKAFMNNYHQKVESVVLCKKCKKEYKQEKYKQVESFKCVEEDICPYCDAVNATSKEYDFFNYRMN